MNDGAIGGHLDCPQCDDERDRAVIARIGGWMVTHWPHARVWTAETLRLAANVGDMRGTFPAMLPEAAFDWPIYRAANVAEVYGALWGQASPAEEKLLDTLAHCAGLQVSLTPAESEPYTHAYLHPDPQDCRDYAQCHARAYGESESEKRAAFGDR